MASPVNDSYSCASGRGIYAGRFNWPAWRSAMAANTWTQIGNTLSSIDPEDDIAINPNYPSSAQWHGTLGVAGMIEAYSGACYDSANDVLWLPLQGGHGDYGGNEPYKISLNSASPAWEMLRNPSGAIGNEITLNDGQDATGLYADGRLRSIHSYNKALYIPGVGPVLSITGATYPGGNLGIRSPAYINPITGELDFLGVENTFITLVTTSGGGSCYDSLRNTIWFIPASGGKVTRYDRTGNSWTDTGIYKASTGYCGLEYLPDYDCIVWFTTGQTNGFAVIDCSTGTIYYPAVSGSYVGVAGPTGSAQPRYVQSLKMIAFWHNSTDTTVINTLSFSSDPRTDTWTISQLPVGGSNAVTPSVRHTQGTYGRFFYSKNLDGFGLLNGVTEPIYFYARS